MITIPTPSGGTGFSICAASRTHHCRPAAVRYVPAALSGIWWGRAMSKWKIARIILLSLAISIGITASMIVAVVASLAGCFPEVFSIVRTDSPPQLLPN